MVKLRLLIVDDNSTERQSLQGMAESCDWDCVCLDSGQQALAYLARADSAACPVIVLDWQMPELDGIKTARLLRQLKPGADAAIVLMLTAHGREVLSGESKRAPLPVDGYLIKPTTASALRDAVVQALARRNDKSKAPTRRAVAPVTARLAGMRLLVVEDNELSQEIAQVLLTQNGASVALAGGGLDGVRQAVTATPPFDAILMDMQLPDIDGLEATRQLRADVRMHTVPIIAMTANALKADKDACRAVGMVDHITKPIDVEKVIETLLRHTSRPDESTACAPHNTSGRAATDTSETTTPQTRLVVDAEAAIGRLGGNRDFYKVVVGAFRVDAIEHVTELKNHWVNGHYHEAQRFAHTLKGLAASVGAPTLAESAADAESMFKRLQSTTGSEDQAKQHTAEHLLADIDDQLMAALGALNQMYPVASPIVVPPTTPPSLDPAAKAALASALRELGELLRSGNMRSIETCDHIVQEFGAQMGIKFVALRQAVKRLDFAKAFDESQTVLRSLL